MSGFSRLVPFGSGSSKKQFSTDSKAGVDNGSVEKPSLTTSPMTSPLLSEHETAATASEVETPSESSASYFPARQVSRSRTLFKASSYLNLRAVSNSSGNKKKTGTGNRDGGVGQQETSAPASNIVENKGTNDDGNTESGQAGSHGPDIAEVSARVLSPVSPPARNSKSQDILQGDANRGGSSAIFNGGDQTWHRPSLLQVVESLHVAIMTTSRPTPSSSARFKHPGLVPTGTSVSDMDAIPGRFRSHVMQTIEGVYQLKSALEGAERRANEAEAARERDLAQFSGLVEEWRVYENGLTEKVRLLEERIHQLEIMQAHETALTESDVLFMHDKDHVTTSSTQFTDNAEAAIREIREICDIDINEKLKGKDTTQQGRLPPAMVTDLDHDKAVSDGLVKSMTAEMAKHPSEPRDQWAGGRQPITRSEISAAQEWDIEKLKESIGYDRASETSVPTSASKKDKGKQKAASGRRTFKRKQHKVAQGKRPAKNEESSESSSEVSSSSSSSSSSSGEEMGTFDPDNNASIHATPGRAGHQL